MNDFRPGVVIPVGEGRKENLAEVLCCLHEQTRKPEAIMLVADGEQAAVKVRGDLTIPMFQVVSPKHKPGREQPRNVGVRHLTRLAPACNAVWFLDTDIIFDEYTLEALARTWEASERERIIIAPYDWLPPGQREIAPELHNDPRWAMFNEPRWTGAEDPAGWDSARLPSGKWPRSVPSESVGELNVGLGCFSGNLVWPIEEFARIGGFWNEIHHGRCEDGELGLRAVAQGVPITCCPGARGYHLWHPINHELAVQRNERDVPMLNARHPWVQEGGLVVVERDGRRFDQRCDRCETVVNSLDWWAHREQCV